MINKDKDFVDITKLMSDSKTHQNWCLKDVIRLVYPPLMLDQYKVYRDIDGRPFGSITWAWLTEEASAGYIDGTRKLQPEDWNAGKELWMIDFITPAGLKYVRHMHTDLHKIFKDVFPVYYIRTKNKERIKGKFGKLI